MPGKEVAKWADKAMFEAEPIKESEGPRVYLLSMNADPLGTIAAANFMYSGRVVRDLSEITHEERLHEFEQLMRTRLKAPFEFVKFNFLIEGVTRAFTHQLVRIRQATFCQESMRFAVKTDMPTALPPSLAGVEHPTRLPRQHHPVPIASTDPEFDRLSDLEQQRVLWDESVEYTADHYLRLINKGMPAEVARGLAPTDVLTRVHISIDLHALLNHAGNRLCTQAQFEWRAVFGQIVKSVREGYRNDPRWVALSTVGDDSPDERKADWLKKVEQIENEYALLASIFAPICYQTGKCEFMSEIDRACSIRERVQASHSIGRTSEHWGEEYDVVEGNPIVVGVGPRSVLVDGDPAKPVFIGAIHPAEWLLDPTAARVR